MSILASLCNPFSAKSGLATISGAKVAFSRPLASCSHSGPYWLLCLRKRGRREGGERERKREEREGREQHYK